MTEDLVQRSTTRRIKALNEFLEENKTKLLKRLLLLMGMKQLHWIIYFIQRV